MRSDHHIAKATTFAQFCWNCAWARTYQSSGYSFVKTGRLERHSSHHQTYWTWALGGGYQVWDDPDASNLLRLSSVTMPATGSRQCWCIWSHRRSGAGFPWSFIFSLVITELKEVDHHKMQWHSKVQSDNRTCIILAPNISKYFQNTLKKTQVVKLYQGELLVLVTRSKIKLWSLSKYHLLFSATLCNICLC